MFLELGEITIPHLDIQLIESVPVVFKEQNHDISSPLPSGPFWLTYGGGVFFMRKTIELLPDFCHETKRVINERFPCLPDFGPERVMVIKTSIKGTYWHADEMNRNTAINIGIKNSNTSLTRFTLEEDQAKFNDRVVDFTCQDGRAYLLNTRRFHKVVSKGFEGFRYLASVSFMEPYETIEKMIKGS